MSSSPELVKKLLNAHYRGDEDGFRALAYEAMEHERKLNHHVVAADIEKLLASFVGVANSRRDVSRLSQTNGSLPKDKERNASLLELSDPRKTLDDLILTEQLRSELDRIVHERLHADILRSHGIAPLSKLLFCGPPGCGKSVAAQAIASALMLPLATVRFDAVVSSYLGETAANLRKVFDYARTHPVVLFFDEFDAIGKHRTSADEHGELKRVVNSFLQLLDGFHAETLTIAATNHQGLLDSALWRRFDEILFFDRPQSDQAKTLLSRLFQQMPVAKPVRLPQIAEMLAGASHADFERVAVDAIKQTILRNESVVSEPVLVKAVNRQLERIAVTSDASRPPELRASAIHAKRSPRKKKASP